MRISLFDRYKENYAHNIAFYFDILRILLMREAPLKVTYVNMDGNRGVGVWFVRVNTAKGVYHFRSWIGWKGVAPLFQRNSLKIKLRDYLFTTKPIKYPNNPTPL